MGPTIRPFSPDDRDAVVGLSLRAWEPVFASIEDALRGSGVFEEHYPDWRTSQRAAAANSWNGRTRSRSGSTPTPPPAVANLRW